MGLRGVGSQRRKPSQAGKAGTKRRRKHPWERKGLSRAARVIAFLESLPCTKGYGAGEPLKLIPEQREWIEAVYADDAHGIRLVCTAVLSAARGNGKTVLIADQGGLRLGMPGLDIRSNRPDRSRARREQSRGGRDRRPGVQAAT